MELRVILRVKHSPKMSFELKKIEEKKDLFNRGHIFEQVKIDNSYPEYLQNNQNKYLEWILK